MAAIPWIVESTCSIIQQYHIAESMEYQKVKYLIVHLILIASFQREKKM